jgi:threonine aldolase
MVEKNLDFRSDTVTWPTPEMREASYKAKVGDDVFGDDPTVNELERIAAEITGKEAALFVTSGTMGNAVSVLAHTNRGDEIILEQRSHIFVNEVGGLAVMGQLMARTVQGELGWMKPEDVEKAIRAENIHYPPTKLVCIENTHNSAGCIALTTKQMKADWDVAKKTSSPCPHGRGAPQRIGRPGVDVMSSIRRHHPNMPYKDFALGRGGRPSRYHQRARKYRKMYGGMRQAVTRPHIT